MTIVYHNIEQLALGAGFVNGASTTVSSNDGQFSNTEALRVGLLNDIPFPVGGGAGAAVVMTFTGMDLPASYSVDAALSVPGTVSVTNKTFTGFIVTLTPTTATLTLAAGFMDVRIFT